MSIAHAGRALLLACLCSACSAPTPPPQEATGAPSPSAAPLPSPSPPASAPAVAETAPPAAPPAAVIEDPVVEAPPVATAPAPAPAPAPVPVPVPVKKPRPLTAVREPAPGPLSVAAAPVPDAAPVQATVTTLSRGKGVPAETREALKRIRALLEERKASASVSALEVQRIGLEGESRLCIEFRSAADAQSALAEMRRIATGSDLLEIAETPCPYRKEPTP